MSALAYTVHDSRGLDVTDAKNPPLTLVAARRVARFYGEGAVVLGARGQIMYRVEPPKEKIQHSPKRPRV